METLEPRKSDNMTAVIADNRTIEKKTKSRQLIIFGGAEKMTLSITFQKFPPV